MTSFVLIPGAGGAAWVWHRVVAELSDRGHDAVAVQLPADDESAGLHEYADIVVATANGRRGAVVVAQSLGAFTAPLAAEGLHASHVVLVNAMVPLPGETAGAWWGNVDSEQARLVAAERGGWTTEIDLETYFGHDVPPEVWATGAAEQRNEADRAFTDPCDFTAWPAPVSAIAGRDDRFFPVEFQQKLARERLGVDAIVVPGGHLAALSHPVEMTDALLSI